MSRQLSSGKRLRERGRRSRSPSPQNALAFGILPGESCDFCPEDRKVSFDTQQIAHRLGCGCTGCALCYSGMHNVRGCEPLICRNHDTFCPVYDETTHYFEMHRGQLRSTTRTTQLTRPDETKDPYRYYMDQTSKFRQEHMIVSITMPESGSAGSEHSYSYMSIIVPVDSGKMTGEDHEKLLGFLMKLSPVIVNIVRQENIKELSQGTPVADSSAFASFFDTLEPDMTPACSCSRAIQLAARYEGI